MFLMRLTRSIALTGLFCLPWMAAAQIDSAKINSLAESWLISSKAPGCAVGIVQDGKLVYAGGFGAKSLATKSVPDKQTSFLIGSLTKQFAATGIMLLRREGKLKLDDPITKYIANAPSDWSNVTLNHLLHHTSGLYNYTDFAVTMISAKAYNLADVIEITAGKKRATAPGEAFSYCNTGYYLLGAVIEKITKRPYFEYLNSRIFRPLGMNRTYIYRRSIPRFYEAIGYSNAPSRFLPPNEITPGAAGNLASTVEDLAKWEAALLGEKILTSSEKKLMWTPYKLNSGEKSNYGMGWGIGENPDLPVIEHGGGIPGFTSYIRHFLNEKTSIIVLKNSMNGSSPSDLVSQIAIEIIPKLAELAKGIPDDNPAETLRIQSFVLSMLANNPDRSQMTEATNRALTPQLVRQVSDQFKQYGNFNKLTLLKRESVGDIKVHTYLAQFSTVSLKLLVPVNSEGKFEGILFQPFP